MKTTILNAVIALVAALSLLGCGRKSGPLPPSVRAAMPASHSLDFENGFVADDLTHGLGAMQLKMHRRWSGADTLNTHFGPGWSDQNVVMLSLVSNDVALLWRAGVGWLTAHRKDGKLFDGDAGLKVEQTDKGWVHAGKGPHHLRPNTGGQFKARERQTGCRDGETLRFRQDQRACAQHAAAEQRSIRLGRKQIPALQPEV